MPAAAAAAVAPEPEPTTAVAPAAGAGRDPHSYLATKLARKATHQPFDFDRWYPSLRKHTWRSVVLPFPPSLARACVNYYQARYNSRVGRFTPADAALLRDLESRLDHEMGAARPSDDGRACSGGQTDGEGDGRDRGGGGVFVRMSNRSPKDGTPLD